MNEKHYRESLFIEFNWLNTVYGQGLLEQSEHYFLPSMQWRTMRMLTCYASTLEITGIPPVKQSFLSKILGFVKK